MEGRYEFQLNPSRIDTGLQGISDGVHGLKYRLED
jgi:hypothetical protein